jgi:hypothetical protein
MTRRISRFVAALSVIGAVAVVPAVPASAETADLVAGTGQFLGDGSPAFPGIELYVTARGGRSGEAASGRFSFRTENVAGVPNSQGSVTCVSVVGNAAVIGGAIEKSDTPTPDGFSGVIMEVRDNGEPGQTVDDQFNFFIVPNPVLSCPSPPFINGLVSVDRGNFVLHNAG